MGRMGQDGAGLDRIRVDKGAGLDRIRVDKGAGLDRIRGRDWASVYGIGQALGGRLRHQPSVIASTSESRYRKLGDVENGLPANKEGSHR